MRLLRSFAAIYHPIRDSDPVPASAKAYGVTGRRSRIKRSVVRIIPNS